MITVYSERHRLRDARTELHEGRLVAPFECPARADLVLDRLRSRDVGPIEAPRTFGLEPVRAVHDEAYIAFLERCWRDWVAAGKEGEAIPVVFPGRRMTQAVPDDIEGRLGYYAFAAETSITETTYEAALLAKDVALTAADRLAGGASAAFALCRPPGHHAARDYFGGYCFFNNAAIAARYLREQGVERVAILDTDFHHGNGTQDIFYEEDDVLFASIHGDPRIAFPHFSGYADERGAGHGLGFTLNLPLPADTDFTKWHQALETALTAVTTFRADALVVSLGVDTYEHDPISCFKLKSDDFFTYGRTLGNLRLPTLFVFEGGYAVEAIGINTANVLMGFDSVRGG